MASTAELTALRDAILSSPEVAAARAALDAATAAAGAAQAALKADSPHEVYAELVRLENARDAARHALAKLTAPADAYQARIDKIARGKVARHIWG